MKTFEPEINKNKNDNSYCLFCNLPRHGKSQYCYIHCSKHGEMSAIKRMRRRVLKLCDILNIESKTELFDKRDIFQDKCNTLIYWIENTNKHKAFIQELDYICDKYIDSETHTYSWPQISIKLFKEIKLVTEKHIHTKKIFHNSFYFGSSVHGLQKKLNLQVFGTIENENILLSTAIDMIKRKSIFLVIEHIITEIKTNKKIKVLFEKPFYRS